VQLDRLYLSIGAASGAVAVMLGAFAAHGLKARLDAAALSAFQTGVTYQFLHSIALCVVATWLREPGRVAGLGGAGAAFIVGIVCFSFSLYALALGAPRWLGPVTPFGGLAFIFGWALLAWGAWRS
jgi:uncharacterized membrane protein YgdD (TMEM256/DUF423 family)